MSKNVLRLMLGLFLVMGMVFTSFAQDDTTDDVDLESVTSNSQDYWGTTVTLEGVIERFVNVNTFVLHEDVLLDDDKVLVVNNSQNYFDPSLFAGMRVQVTGVVQPSFENIMEGATRFDVIGMDTDVNAGVDTTTDTDLTAMPETPVVTDPNMTTGMMDRGDTLQFFYDANFPEDYNGFTIIEVTDVQQIFTVENE